MRTRLFLAAACISLAASGALALEASQPQGGGASYARVRVAVPFQGTDSSSDASSLVTIEEFPVNGDGKSAEPRVLATLYGNAITEEDVVKEMWERRGRETFEWMVGRDLLKRELRRHTLEISDSEVDARLQKHLESLGAAFPNLKRPDDLTRAASGMPLEEYRERSVWVELALRKIMTAVMKPDEDKLRATYANIQAEFIRPERVRISQVFIAPQPPPEADGIAGPDDWARAERQIVEAHNRLRMGEEFREVAGAYGSGGQFSRWIERGELLRDLEEAAFGIRPGSVTAPIRTSMGYHILTVEEKQERKVPPFEEVRDEVRVRYEEEQFVRLAGEFMARLKRNALKNGGLVLSEEPDVFAEAAGR